MILQTKNLSFSYGGFGLEDVSIEIKRGSICGLLGTNGSGKSTFFNCCMKFLSIKGGRNLRRFAKHEAQKPRVDG